MTKDVIISIKGVQTDFVDNNQVEMITAGQYYKKNEKHYIQYLDNNLQDNQETKTTVKIGTEKIEILRHGGTNTHMIFEMNKKNMTHYDTPFGALLIGVKTKEINFKEEENQLDLEVIYQLEINHNYIGDNSFELKVQNKKTTVIDLREEISNYGVQGDE
jgi:uncharacterized beta-barrel protein YwiB (DUF1934 family)